MHDFRPGGTGDDEELFLECAIGAIGGFLGAAVVKARKKKKKRRTERRRVGGKIYFAAGKKESKNIEDSDLCLRFFCAFTLGAFSVRATQVAGREANKRINSTKIPRRFETLLSAALTRKRFRSLALAKRREGNEMFLRDAHFMKARLRNGGRLRRRVDKLRGV